MALSMLAAGCHCTRLHVAREAQQQTIPITITVRPSVASEGTVSNLSSSGVEIVYECRLPHDWELLLGLNKDLLDRRWEQEHVQLVPTLIRNLPSHWKRAGRFQTVSPTELSLRPVSRSCTFFHAASHKLVDRHRAVSA